MDLENYYVQKHKHNFILLNEKEIHNYDNKPFVGIVEYINNDFYCKAS